MLKQMMSSVLNGDVLENALDFAEFLTANAMNVADAEISYQGKPVAYMHLGAGDVCPSPWTIWTEGDYTTDSETISLDSEQKALAWDKVDPCASCGGECAPGTNRTIFGREFSNICNAVMVFYQPNAEELVTLKKLLTIRKFQIDSSKT